MGGKKWRKWWTIPLAYGVAECIQYLVNMAVLTVMIERLQPPPGQERMEFAKQLADRADVVMLLFSLALLAVMAFIFRRTCHREDLLRSATVTAVYIFVVRAAFNLHIPVPLSLLLLWGPQAKVMGRVTTVLGLSPSIAGQAVGLLLTFAFPYLFVLLAKPAPAEGEEAQPKHMQ